MQDNEFVDGLLEFIQASPTPFHACRSMSASLANNGFTELHEADEWKLHTQGELATGRYFVTRNDSSIIAFTINKEVSDDGFRMVGAHTDSPCLKVKPQPEIIKHGYLQLGVEVYGGALLNPWFDRDLSLAGRVSYLNGDDELKEVLIDFEQAIAVIPSLAIHLDREANEKRSVNKQTQLPPVLLKLPPDMAAENKPVLRTILLEWLNKNHVNLQAREVLDYELSFYDVQAPAVIGLHQDFIAAARLDNLLSCYTGMQALLDEQNDSNAMLVCNDHEEVGSMSAAGAQGPFLKTVLQRLCPQPEQLAIAIDRSLMISADNAHGVHPNYSDKHDSNHGPILNEGPVIKTNANQRYATNSFTSASFKRYCRRADVPVQQFVTRSDMGCGSTIGPITASETGVATIDVGVPTFAMHSIRELAGRWDAYYLYRALREFYRG